MKNIKMYQVFITIGALGVLNTISKLLLPNFNYGDGIISYMFAFPFMSLGLLNWSTGPLVFLWLFDGAPLWLAIGIFLYYKK